MVRQFLVDVTISHEELPSTKRLHLRVTISKNDRDYGNGLYMAIEGRDKTNFNEIIDLRYMDIDINKLGCVIANWVYNTWHGMNGAWYVVKLSIEKVN